MLMGDDQPRATPPDPLIDVWRYLRDDVVDVLADTTDPGRMWYVAWNDQLSQPDGPPTSFCRAIVVSDGSLSAVRALLLPHKLSPQDSTYEIGRRAVRIDVGFGLPAGKREELYGPNRECTITLAELQAAIIPDTLQRDRDDVTSSGGAVTWSG